MSCHSKLRVSIRFQFWVIISQLQQCNHIAVLFIYLGNLKIQGSFDNYSCLD